MRQQLLAAIEARGGLIRRAEAMSVVAEHVVDDAVRGGAMVPVFPGVYALPGIADDRTVRQRGALAYLPGAALSHLDGLERWRLLPQPCVAVLEHEPVHLTASAATCAEVNVPGLRVTRRQWFTPTSPYVVVRGGDRLVRLEQAVLESWPLLPAEERRAPVIRALRERRTTAERLRSVLALQPRTAGARQLRGLIDLVASGCHSELELWGHDHLFRHPGLRRARSQVPLDLPTGRIYLDRYFDLEMLAVELDGATTHGDPQQRERDLVRDAMLGRRGILVVRYSHRRLHREAALVVDELLATLAMRRCQLGRAA